MAKKNSILLLVFEVMQTSLSFEQDTKAPSRRYVKEFFETEEKRREHFLTLLKKKLEEPEFTCLPGFPKGSTESILANSDPPFYTLCPNPFLDLLLTAVPGDQDDDSYQREPFATDVSEGRGETIYNAHGYHTKVPHKAIMRYILHYTNPGDLVYDGFCGTGMTGVASQLCGDRTTVQSLGYRVQQDGTILDDSSKPVSKLGVRRCILNDLSPAATFIANNYNTPVGAADFNMQIRNLITEMEENVGWMFSTLHEPSTSQIQQAIDLLKTTPNKSTIDNSKLPIGEIIYSVWSDVFICPECTGELIFWDAAIVQDEGKVLDEFPCPHCKANLRKRHMDHVFDIKHDSTLGTSCKIAKTVPVLISYKFNGRRFEKRADAFDIAFTNSMTEMPVEGGFPSNEIAKGDKTGEPLRLGIDHVHQFYTARNLQAMAFAYNIANSSTLLWALTGISQRATKMHQIAISRVGGPKKGVGGATAGHRRGTLYIPSNQVEFSPIQLLKERASVIVNSLKQIEHFGKDTFVSTGSASASILPENSLDYIFVDPPFGGNIMYSELNFIWESFLQVFSNIGEEAIQNNSQHKGLVEYQKIMTDCFRQFYRALKPGRWMTVEFHNSKNSVWNAIQEALEEVGFVVATVNTLNKQLQTHTQRTAAGSVDKDLAISAYKPSSELEDRFKLEAGTEDGVWDFIRNHLKQLPVFIKISDKCSVIAERQQYLLFDRMVAFHVQRGVTIPISASEFYTGLPHRYSERDGMFFLPEQVALYDQKKMNTGGLLQGTFTGFVDDEISAVDWLRYLLKEKPQTFQKIYPQFTLAKAGWKKTEKQLELTELLDENFYFYDGLGPVPVQIHSYLSKNWPEMRKLVKDDPQLKEKAANRWCVPDPKDTSQIEQMREKRLLREFDLYKVEKKKIKVIRLEAVRAGFKKAWQNKDYLTIISVATKIPTSIIQEDQKLLMWYSNACTRADVNQ